MTTNPTTHSTATHPTTPVYIPVERQSIEPFDGEGNQSIDKFLRDFRWCYGHLPINMQRLYLVQHLQGHALDVFNSFPQEVQEGPWGTLTRNLKNFLSRYDRTSVHLVCQQLHALRKLPSQTLSQFVSDIELTAYAVFDGENERDFEWLEALKATTLIQNAEDNDISTKLSHILLEEHSASEAFDRMQQEVARYKQSLALAVPNNQRSGHVAVVTTREGPKKRPQRDDKNGKIKRLQMNRDRLSRKIAKLGVSSEEHPPSNAQTDLIRNLEGRLQQQESRIGDIEHALDDLYEELSESDAERESKGSTSSEEQHGYDRALSQGHTPPDSAPTTCATPERDAETCLCAAIALSEKRKQLMIEEGRRNTDYLKGMGYTSTERRRIRKGYPAKSSQNAKKGPLRASVFGGGGSPAQSAYRDVRTVSKVTYDPGTTTTTTAIATDPALQPDTGQPRRWTPLEHLRQGILHGHQGSL